MRVRYFGASVDTPEANARFADSLGAGYPILSDPTKTAARAYGVLGASGFASRWTFYIGADGRILDIDKNVTAATHGRDIVSKVRKGI
jgi:peroxiredoxin Q/BCP